jgi:hypothetical protein
LQLKIREDNERARAAELEEQARKGRKTKDDYVVEEDETREPETDEPKGASRKKRSKKATKEESDEEGGSAKKR